jgi:hypothetical protein
MRFVSMLLLPVLALTSLSAHADAGSVAKRLGQLLGQIQYHHGPFLPVDPGRQRNPVAGNGR